MKLRHAPMALLFLAATILPASCGSMSDPASNVPPRKQSTDPATVAEASAEEAEYSGNGETAGPDGMVVTAKLNHLKRENVKLKADQEELQATIATLRDDLAREREEQRRFREMMATNFELLEQSVARTLASGSGERRQQSHSARANAMPQAPNAKGALRDDAAGNMDTAPRNRPMPAPPATEASTAAPPALEWEATPANAPPSAASEDLPAAAGVMALPVLAIEEDRNPYEDPDLIPPANPIVLKPIQEAKPLYEKGFVHFAKGKYEDSIQIFRDLLQRFPADNHSDNAQFWIGEAQFRLKKYLASEAAYRAVLRNYEHRGTLEGFKTPDSIYRLGQIQLVKERTQRAEYYFSNVVRRFPSSTAGQKARRELDAIQVDTASGDRFGEHPDS